MDARLNRRLFVAMFREELRLQRAFIGKVAAVFFPVMIFFFSVVLAVAFSFFRGISIPTVLLLLHGGFVVYGLGVGALALIGEQVMTRRLGQASMLLQLPQVQPVTFRRVMAVFYLKDATFYVIYSILPLLGGIAVAAPLAGIPWTSVALLAVTLSLTFMLGMSLSFLISAIAVRSRRLVVPVGLVLLVTGLLIWPLGAVPAGYVLVPLGFWAAKEPVYLAVSAVLVVLLSAAAILLSKERFEAPSRTYRSALLPTEEAFAFAGASRTLVAKEWIEIRRSGSLGAVVFEYLAPLLTVYLLAWVFRAGIGVPIEFNAIFYGGLIGFLGVMVYSWLTNVEPNEFLNAQPATVGQVIRAKLVLYFLLTSVTSFSYVVVIGAVEGQLALLPLSILVAAASTVYVAGVITRLTGLWTNTMLFDARVLAKFSGAVIPPLIAVMICSFLIARETWLATGVLVALSAILLVASRFLFRSAAERWSKEHFSFAALGTTGE